MRQHSGLDPSIFSNSTVLRPDPSQKILRILFAVGLVLASFINVAHRHTMNADALSYLEVGETWLRGDVARAINGYWSPLYPILMAASGKLFPRPDGDTFGPHLLNVILFALACLAFKSFYQTLKDRVLGSENSQAEKTFALVSGSVFLWGGLRVNDISELFPDLLVMIFVFVAARAMLRLDGHGTRAALTLGLALGLGYLSKPVMFPLGLVILICSIFAACPFRRGLALAGGASAVFAGISACYIVPLSLQKDRFTFSDSGSLAYAWEVNGVSPYFHWQGEPPGTGQPKNPTRKILNYPPTYEFDRGQLGTYPLWRDASHWNEGLELRFEPRAQAKRLLKSAAFYLEFARKELIPIILGFSFLLGGTLVGWKRYASASREFVPLIIGFAVPFALYAMVFLKARYLAPFVVVLSSVAGAIYLRARQGFSESDRAWARLTASIVVALLVVSSMASAARGFRGTMPTSYVVHRKIAAALTAAGVPRGAKLGVIGRGCDGFFARILDGQIVTEAIILEGHPEWAPTLQNLDRIAAAMAASTEAVAIVSSPGPAEAEDHAWRNVPGTSFWFRILERTK